MRKTDRPPLRLARPVARLVQGKRDWYKITPHLQAKAADGGGEYAEVLLFDEIGYWGITAQDFVQDLASVNTDNITVRINSPGGEIFDGVAIYNALKQHRAHVITQVDGLAASAASFIAMAGDTIRIAKTATMMIHEGHALVVGNSADMLEMAERLDKTSDNIAGIYADRAGGTVAEWRNAMRAETWYSAAEAKDAGLADEIIGEEGNPADNSWDLSIFNYAGRDKAPAPHIAAGSIESRGETPFDYEEARRALKEAFK